MPWILLMLDSGLYIHDGENVNTTAMRLVTVNQRHMANSPYSLVLLFKRFPLLCQRRGLLIRLRSSRVNQTHNLSEQEAADIKKALKESKKNEARDGLELEAQMKTCEHFNRSSISHLLNQYLLPVKNHSLQLSPPTSALQQSSSVLEMPLFNEYYNLPPRTVSPDLVAIVASRAVDPVGSPSSTTIDQDEQSTSTSPTNQEICNVKSLINFLYVDTMCYDDQSSRYVSCFRLRRGVTNINHERRFYGCRMEALNCGFVGWVDPPMYERAMDVIPWLLRARNMLEEDLEVHVLKTNGEVVGWVKEDDNLCCSSSTPLKTRHKKKVVDSKKVHRGVNIKIENVVTTKQKFVDKEKGKVNEDEEVLRHKDKVVVTNYRRSFNNRKAIMIKDVRVVTKKGVQPRPNDIVIREDGVMKVQADVGVVNNKQQVLSRATML
ncbi:hypothetical protein Tco_0475335 [Tanacetum coccineum]